MTQLAQTGLKRQQKLEPKPDPKLNQQQQQPNEHQKLHLDMIYIVLYRAMLLSYLLFVSCSWYDFTCFVSVWSNPLFSSSSRGESNLFSTQLRTEVGEAKESTESNQPINHNRHIHSKVRGGTNRNKTEEGTIRSLAPDPWLLTESRDSLVINRTHRLTESKIFLKHAFMCLVLLSSRSGQCLIASLAYPACDRMHDVVRESRWWDRGLHPPLGVGVWRSVHLRCAIT